MSFNFCRLYNKIQIKVNGIVGNEYEKKKSVNIFVGIIGLVFLIPTLILLLLAKALFNVLFKINSYIPKPKYISEPKTPINYEALAAGITILGLCGAIIFMVFNFISIGLAISISGILLWILGTLGIVCILEAIGYKNQSNWLATWILEKPISYLWDKTTSQCELTKKD